MINTKKHSIFEKRKDVVRPLNLTICGLVFFLIPIVNLGQLFIPSEYRFVLFTVFPFLNSFSLTIEHTAVHHVTSGMEYLQMLTFIDIILLILPMFVGFGILSMTQIGKWMFMIYSGGLILYNLSTFVFFPINYNFITLVNSLVLTFIVNHFLNKDILNPYNTDIHKKSWGRMPFVNDAVVNGIPCTTRDISYSGTFVYLENSNLELEQEVIIQFKLKDKNYSLKGGVARIEKEGIGIEFLFGHGGMDAETMKEIKNMLRELQSSVHFYSPTEATDPQSMARVNELGNERVQKRLFTVDEYEKMARSGIVKPEEQAELVEGELYSSSPLEPKHAFCIDKLLSFFSETLKKRAILRVQNPILINNKSELLPDLSIVQNKDYSKAHPLAEDVYMIIEVSSGSFDYDKNTKLPVYAAAGVLEVWLINLDREYIDIFRKPSNLTYQFTERYFNGSVSPQSFADIILDLNFIMGKI